VSEDGVYLGEVLVPAGAFPPGTVLHISPFEGPSPEKQNSESGDCGEEKKKQQLTSAVFDVQAIYPKGSRRSFKKPIQISQIVSLKVLLLYSLFFYPVI